MDRSDPVRAVVSRVTALGGVARPTVLAREGHSRYRVGQALDAGLLVRVRRDWVATPSADPQLIAAARNGVVLSCVTMARRLGLWVAEAPALPHVAHPGHGRVARLPGAVVHWQHPVVPRHPDALEDTVQNVLMTVACCQPYERAKAIWESALNKRLVELSALARLPWTGTARVLAVEVTPWADSGLETLFVVRLRWMGLPIRTQIWIRGHRVDILIGDRLVVQIDGGHHVGAQRAEDIRHDAELTLMGYHVIRVGYDQVMHCWHEVQDLIMQAVAQGLHRA
ncbi:MAG: DUF559 domain-containing protein [Microbacterium sp.]|uniref:endonuclease domain-containing protein n=1 Tax=Microbacterium sp. TaxID=51671 RepID=UPI0039E421CA